MRNGFKSDDRATASMNAGRIAAFAAAAGLFLAAVSVDAADIQEATDRAAVRAKSELCIAFNVIHRSRPVPNKAAIEARIPQLKEKFLAFHEGKRVAADPLSPETFQVGQIGPLPPFEVAQVVGPNEMHATIGPGRFILRNYSTADVADGQRVEVRKFWRVGKPETYNTAVGGTKTVYVLEPAGEHLADVKASRVYPWYNIKDEVVVTGEFRAIEGPKAVFLVDGQETSVALVKFTPGDRDVMRLLWDRHGPENRPAGNSGP